ncbi:N-acetylglucosamine-6-phosphate deacetylase [Sporosarcina sp. Marseille-Q4063]|uniref:N-acetylglucosamine-6-phosphate deacetylase n=1 Tax=Sporosarcina sp. Marseille-Q4063 TaxID=2810514 RepID=UPI001BAF0598|nr:N-acetylglucosamine-6-phosphate deacetylase [Sporosarcina sp. Marseille-Q4063]QUW21532.1 N-acetylglucosamine-6-phosphate deacetylase [Sporosarcina sp. Marseille-Q4063]
MGDLYLTNATIVLENRVLSKGFIHIIGERIESVGEMEACPPISDLDKIYDCSDKQYVIPGMIDIHVHGAAGYDFMDGNTKAVEAIAFALTKEGVTSFLATTITNPVDYTSNAIGNLNSYSVHNNKPGVAELVGIHLEGPFINKEQKGAQPEESILPPNVVLFKEWQELSGNTIKIITYAPELDINFELLTELNKTEVIPSMGHTNATYDESIHAIHNGVSHATHLFNGMKGFHHREPGVVGAVLLRDDVYVEIIPDGIHFHSDLVKLIVKMKGLEKVLVITDGMRAKGLPDGNYDLGGQEVIVSDGSCLLVSTGSLAGSVVTMNNARLNLVEWLDLSIVEQVQVTSVNQAKRLEIFDRKGSIEAGKDADLVVLGSDGQIELTICRGKISYQRES